MQNVGIFGNIIDFIYPLNMKMDMNDSKEENENRFRDCPWAENSFIF